MTTNYWTNGQTISVELGWKNLRTSAYLELKTVTHTSEAASGMMRSAAQGYIRSFLIRCRNDCFTIKSVFSQCKLVFDLLWWRHALCWNNVLMCPSRFIISQTEWGTLYVTHAVVWDCNCNYKYTTWHTIPPKVL